jgi:hypothetical protein
MISKKNIGLAVLAISAAFSLPAYAQGESKQPPAMGMQPMMGMEHKGPRHPEFHEEMMKLRAEQEELDIARDKLLDKCMFAPKELAPSCTKEREDLRTRSEKLRADKKAMQEKMEKMRGERKEMREQRREHRLDRKTMPMSEKGAPLSSETPAKK